MNLNVIWFILIAVLYSGYFILEGFDLGVGILLPFLSKDNIQRRKILNTIGPHWDGNEVWLITAGGATFAAFPGWYATLFSGFYLPLFLILLGLIFRGIAIEFRSRDTIGLWQNFWDWALCVGSFIPALLFGVAFANFMRGVPIDGSMNYAGGFWNLLNPYALVGGLLSLSIFLLQGSIFLMIKINKEMTEKIRGATKKIWSATVLLLIVFSSVSYFVNDSMGINPLILVILTILTLLITGWLTRQKKDGLAFLFNTLTILFGTASIFLKLFPRVLVSSLKPEWSLTIYNSSSGSYTLQVMSIVALVFVPVVLAYQAWSYWVFRKRVIENSDTLHY